MERAIRVPDPVSMSAMGSVSTFVASYQLDFVIPGTAP